MNELESEIQVVDPPGTTRREEFVVKMWYL
jgi:hypothetical protein